MILYVAETNTTHCTRLMTYETIEKCEAAGVELAENTMDAYPNDNDTWYTCSLERV